MAGRNMDDGVQLVTAAAYFFESSQRVYSGVEVARILMAMIATKPDRKDGW